MKRRKALTYISLAGSVGLAGCSSSQENTGSSGNDEEESQSDSEYFNVVGNRVEKNHVINPDEPHVIEERSAALEYTFSSDVSIGDSYRSANAGQGEIVLIQDVDIANVGDDAVSIIIQGFFTLVDEDGREFSPHITSQSPGQLNPGTSGTARIVLVIPRFQNTRAAMRVQGQQIFTSEKTRWFPYGELSF